MERVEPVAWRRALFIDRGWKLPRRFPAGAGNIRVVPFAICNEIYTSDPDPRGGGWTPERTFEHAAKTGYDAVELAPFTVCRRVTELGALDRSRLRDSARQAGIGICGIHWLLAQTEGFHVTHPEAGVRERTARYLRDLVDFGADLGGGILVFGSPKQRNRLPGVEPETAWDHATAVFRDAVARAEDRGVVICFEPLSPAETDFINTAAEARRFAAQFRSPSMRIILDVKAMSSESKSIPEIIRESRGDFAHFHANDPNMKGPGFGDMDFLPIAAALREVGYAGQVSVEVFRFEEGPDEIARRSLACLRTAFNGGGAAE
ncbi:MAG: sugar phosphate isomerase/epimerase family protein [Limisphaerales bacterium]